MIIANLPTDDELRQQEVESLEILDTPTEKEFDDLVELAAQICDCPISTITLLDNHRQWFKASKGLDDTETPRDFSFCTHAVLQDDVMVVEDALNDERFSDNPLVTGDPNIRFYAGTPIISPAGHKLGAVCVIDHEPRKLTEAQRLSLLLMAKQVTKLLELRLNNKMIRQKAEEVIALKNETIEKTMQQQEQEKSRIATELHENVAQSLAASRIYLGMAEADEQQRLSLLKDSSAQLGDLLQNLRTLSNSITPSALGTMPLDALLNDFVYNKKDTLAFKLKFNCEGEPPYFNAEQTIACVRIIEQWLKVTEAKNNVSNAMIRLNYKKNIRIWLEDDGDVNGTEETERELITNLVYDRVANLGGTISIENKPKKNILFLKLPIGITDPLLS